MDILYSGISYGIFWIAKRVGTEIYIKYVGNEERKEEKERILLDEIWKLQYQVRTLKSVIDKEEIDKEVEEKINDAILTVYDIMNDKDKEEANKDIEIDFVII